MGHTLGRGIDLCQSKTKLLTLKASRGGEESEVTIFLSISAVSL